MRLPTSWWRTAAVATAVAVPLLGVSVARADTGPAPAPSAATGTADHGARLAKACTRIPKRVERLERVQTRFHADAATRGSIAFLTARIAKADADGHADLARLLRDRLAVRKDLDGQLPDILAKLADAQQVCAEHASPATSPQASS